MSTDQHVATSTKSTSGLGIAGFVTGLLGALLSWIPIAGIVLGVLGIVLGGVATAQARRSGAAKGLATAGIVLGAIGVVIAVVIVTAVVSNA